MLLIVTCSTVELLLTHKRRSDFVTFAKCKENVVDEGTDEVWLREVSRLYFLMMRRYASVCVHALLEERGN